MITPPATATALILGSTAENIQLAGRPECNAVIAFINISGDGTQINLATFQSARRVYVHTLAFNTPDAVIYSGDPNSVYVKNMLGVEGQQLRTGFIEQINQLNTMMGCGSRVTLVFAERIMILTLLHLIESHLDRGKKHGEAEMPTNTELQPLDLVALNLSFGPNEEVTAYKIIRITGLRSTKT